MITRLGVWCLGQWWYHLPKPECWRKGLEWGEGGKRSLLGHMLTSGSLHIWVEMFQSNCNIENIPCWKDGTSQTWRGGVGTGMESACDLLL